MMANAPPPFSALRAFDAAARAGEFKAAARRLNVTPTAISHQIRGLEERLGVALFDRLPRGVRLTAAGARLAEATREAFDRIEAALDDIAGEETVLRVTTTPAFALLWLVPRLQAFERAHRGARIQIDTSTATVDLWRDRRVDVAVRYGEENAPGGLWSRPLIRETFSAYGAAPYLQTLARFEDAALLETRWRNPDLPEMTWACWALRAGCDPSALGPRIRRFEDEHFVVQAGLGGQGLVLLSDVLAQDHAGRGLLVPYRPDVRLDGLCYRLVAVPAAASSRKVRLFADWMVAEMRAG